MRVLVTGAAGFIGFHLVQRLLARGDDVVGLDNLNTYYDVRLKEARLTELQRSQRFLFVRADIADREAMSVLFQEERPTHVVNLAAQAGVRYSLTHPHAYTASNMVGFLNILEGCRQSDVQHLVFASSSSVYGANARQPFSVHDSVDHPVSLYAASKKANELMAHSYAHLYNLPCTGLRFFTVYGPWGRPDMAYFLFTRAILAGQPIDVFNGGHHKRDFTYVDDVVDGLVRALDRPAAANPRWDPQAPDPATSAAPYRIYNLGNSQPVELMRLIEALETALGREALKNFLPPQPGDVAETFADTSDFERDFGTITHTPIEAGIADFVAWYRSFFPEKADGG